MAFKQSRQILAGYPALNALDASGPVVLTADYLVPTGGLLVGDIIEMFGLAENLVLADLKLISEDADTGTTLTMDVGFLSGQYGALLDDVGAARTIGSEFLAASTVGQAGGVVSANKQNGYLTAPNIATVSVGIKIAAAPTGQVAGARLRLVGIAHAMPVSV